jgi:hypothetical protein
MVCACRGLRAAVLGPMSDPLAPLHFPLAVFAGRRIVKDAGVQAARTAVAAPNMNALAERFVRTIKDECLPRLIFFCEAMLRRPWRSSSRTITKNGRTRALAT